MRPCRPATCSTRAITCFEAADSRLLGAPLGPGGGANCGAGCSAPRRGRVARPRLAAPHRATWSRPTTRPAPALIEALVARPRPAGRRLARSGVAEGAAAGPVESFLALVRRQVWRAPPASDSRLRHGDGNPSAGRRAGRGGRGGWPTALGRLAEPMRRARRAPAAPARGRPENPPEPRTRQRIDAMVRGLDRRADLQLGGWRAHAARLAEPPPARDSSNGWRSSAIEGAETDVGDAPPLDRSAACRSPQSVAQPAHGMLVTSATLTDGEADAAEPTGRPRRRAPGAPSRRPGLRAARIPSPFDYPAQTRIFIVTDVARDDLGAGRRRLRALILASGGGALGLFTAIARLRAVHERIAPALEAAGLPLYAQHVDAMSTATLVDIFRAEEDSCLLGTDAVRDGVDVPGPLAAPDRLRPRAVAAPRHPAPRAQAGIRRRRVRRPHRPAAAAPGLWPADAAGDDRGVFRSSTGLPSRTVRLPPAWRSAGPLAEAAETTRSFWIALERRAMRPSRPRSRGTWMTVFLMPSTNLRHPEERPGDGRDASEGRWLRMQHTSFPAIDA